MDKKKKKNNKGIEKYTRKFGFWEVYSFYLVSETLIGIPITLSLKTPYAEKYKTWWYTCTPLGIFSVWCKKRRVNKKAKKLKNKKEKNNGNNK